MFNTKLPIYSIMIIISLIANVVIVMLNYSKKYFKRDEIVGALVYENIGIIFGAKILAFFEGYPNVEFDLMKLGLSSYGAVIGAIICLIIFSWQFKKPCVNLLYTFILPIPLMYAIGKIGCFMVGCCYGIKYSGLGSIAYTYSKVAPNNVSLFPVQIVETIAFIGIFIYLLYRRKKETIETKEIAISFILSGVTKFCLEFFRMSHEGIIISGTQIISIVFILIGFVLIKKYKKE